VLSLAATSHLPHCSHLPASCLTHLLACLTHLLAYLRSLACRWPTWSLLTRTAPSAYHPLRASLRSSITAPPPASSRPSGCRCAYRGGRFTTAATLAHAGMPAAPAAACIHTWPAQVDLVCAVPGTGLQVALEADPTSDTKALLTMRLWCVCRPSCCCWHSLCRARLHELQV
jgi:hypothetical protein